MTLIVGYIYRDSVLVIADSAVTINGMTDLRDLGGEHTTFGESTIEDVDGESVGESANKLLKIYDKLVLTFAGSFHDATKATEDIYNEITFRPNRKISSICLEYFNSNLPNDIYFIAGFYEDGKPVLIGKDNGVYTIASNDHVVMYGSGFPSYSEPLSAFIANGKVSNFCSPEEQLVATIAKAQSISLNTLTLKYGVGGFFNGVYIDSNGLNWAPDTFYIMTSAIIRRKLPSFFVVKYIREDVIYVGSTYGKQLDNKTLFSVRDIDKEDWSARWQMELHNKKRRLEGDYYVILSYDRPYFIIVNKKVADTKKWIGLETIEQNDQWRLLTNDAIKHFMGGTEYFDFTTNALSKHAFIFSEDLMIGFDA